MSSDETVPELLGVDEGGVDEVVGGGGGGWLCVVVGVGVGDGDGDDVEDFFVGSTSPSRFGGGDECGRQDVFEVVCVGDVTVVDELLDNLMGGVGETSEGVEIATGVEDPAGSVEVWFLGPPQALVTLLLESSSDG